MFRQILPTLLLAGTLTAPSSIVHAGPPLPELGDPSANYIDPALDQKLGKAFMRSIRQQAVVISDPAVNAYLNSIANRLLSHTDTHLTNFTFFIIESDTINAFAGPGGHIGIHTGLIEAATSEGELAAVMAHEIAHVTQRHLARAFQKASDATLPTAAAIIAAILLSGKHPDLAQAAIMTASAGSIQRQLNFTRAHEHEADRVGIDILAKAGYNAKHMAGFFSRLQESYRFMQSDLPEILRTHPVTPNRIADAQSRAAKLKPGKDGFSPDFELFRARVSSLSERDPSTRLSAIDKSPIRDETLRYEKGLLTLKQGDFPDAVKISSALLKSNPEQLFYIALSAEALIEAGDLTEAERQLKAALQLYPSHTHLSKLLARCLIEDKRAAEAIPILRSLTEKHTGVVLADYFLLLAEAENSAARPAEAHMSMAEHYYLMGETRSAIKQLEKAQHLAGEANDYLSRRITTRLTLFKQEALQEESLEKGR